MSNKKQKNSPTEEEELRCRELAVKLDGTLDISNNALAVSDYYHCPLDYGRSPKKLVITKIDLNDSDECLVQAYSYGKLRSVPAWYLLPKKDPFGGIKDATFPLEKVVYVDKWYYSSRGSDLTGDDVENIIKTQERFTDEQLKLLGAKRIKRITKTVIDYCEQ